MLPKNWARRLKIHESAQRNLCRVTVLTCALLPVLVMMLATVCWRSSWYTHQQASGLANTISQSCGVSATIGVVRAISPTRLEILEIKLAHPETFEPILKSPRAIAYQMGQQWLVQLDSARCDVDQLLKLARTAHDRFLCRADDRLVSMQIICPKTQVVTSGTELMNGQIEVIFVPKSQKSSLQVSLTPDREASQAIDLRFVRNRESTSWITTIELATNGYEIPIRLFQGLYPTSQRLGPDATFSGQAVWTSGDDDRMMIGKSLIKNCQWEKITSPLAYSLSGTGEVYLDEAVVISGRIQQARGTLLGSSGTINSEWLSKAPAALRMQLRPGALKGAGVTKPFTNMKLLFGMNQHGVILRGGILPPQQDLPNVVLQDADGPLLYEPTEQLQLMEPIQWLAAQPQTESIGPVTAASYQSPMVSPPSSVSAYLMTTLPLPDSLRR